MDNRLLEAIALADLSKRQIKILVAVIRQTLGWNREDVTLAASVLSEMTGIDPRCVRKAVADMVEMGILKSSPTPQGKRIHLNADPSKWSIQGGAILPRGDSTKGQNDQGANHPRGESPQGQNVPGGVGQNVQGGVGCFVPGGVGQNTPPSNKKIKDTTKESINKDTVADATFDLSPPEAEQKPAKKRKAPAGKKPQLATRPSDVPEEYWDAWLYARSAKGQKAPSRVALNGLIREAGLAGWPVPDAVREAAERGWITFRAEYVIGKVNPRMASAGMKCSGAPVREGVADRRDAEFLGERADGLVASGGALNRPTKKVDGIDDAEDAVIIDQQQKAIK